MEGEEALDQDEITDITTNFLACQSSMQTSSQKDVHDFMQKYCNDEAFEKTYEYYFNLSQVYLKDQCTEQGLKTLKDAFEKSK